MDKEKETQEKEQLNVWSSLLQMVLDMHETRVENDKVNHPQHYQSENGMEVIEVIEAFNLSFNLGNAIKYILRSDKKGAAIEDLQKAIWYLKREKLRLSTEGEDNGQG